MHPTNTYETNGVAVIAHRSGRTTPYHAEAITRGKARFARPANQNSQTAIFLLFLKETMRKYVERTTGFQQIVVLIH